MKENVYQVKGVDEIYLRITVVCIKVLQMKKCIGEGVTKVKKIFNVNFNKFFLYSRFLLSRKKKHFHENLLIRNGWGWFSFQAKFTN